MTNTNGKLQDPKLREGFLALAKETPEPFGVTYAAKQLKIAWVTARAILTDLVNEGLLVGRRTTQGMVYFLPSQMKPEIPA